MVLRGGGRPRKHESCRVACMPDFCGFLPAVNLVHGSVQKLCLTQRCLALGASLLKDIHSGSVRVVPASGLALESFKQEDSNGSCHI